MVLLALHGYAAAADGCQRRMAAEDDARSMHFAGMNMHRSGMSKWKNFAHSLRAHGSGWASFGMHWPQSILRARIGEAEKRKMAAR